MDKVDVEEKKKMFDIMKDRELGGNMDWMYRGEKTDGEEFLLGKSVDKLLTEATNTTEEGGTSIISERIKANVALDMQAKMREDPLFAIRKKEEEARKRLLENPVKMKQLEKLVEQQKQQLKSKSSKKAKKEKKSKKKKKKKSRGSDSDSDSSESEDDLVNQYLKILTQKKESGEPPEKARQEHKHPQANQNPRNWDHNRHPGRGEEFHHRHRDSHQQTHSGRHRGDDWDVAKSRRNADRDSRRSSESPPRHRKKERSSSREPEPEPEPPRVRQRQDSGDGEVSKRVYGLIKSVRHNMAAAAAAPPPETTMKSERRKRSNSSSSPGAARSRSRSPKRPSNRKEPRGRSSSSPKHHKSKRRRSSSRSRSRSPVRKRNFSPKQRQRSKSPPPRKRRSRSPPKKKLTAEEREKKLQEMMDDAKWHDEQRTKNVQRYKKDDEKEASHLSKYQGDAGFLSSMMSNHASNSTVEDRLKRNKYNIQRTNAALDKKFTHH
ncbi:hypothetical protein ACOMHN_020937 [Nucella lapillus]